MGNIMVLLFLILLIIRVPVAFSLGISCLMYLIVSGVPVITLPQMMLSTFESFTLLAIPLFMLAGQVMNVGGVTTKLFLFCKSLVGHIPGGLGHVNVLASLIFAGMSGSATADAAGLGTIEINYMKQEGYDADFAAAVTAASSTVGTIMPPSLGFVIYGAITGVSIGGLFLAGILPAVVITLFQMGIVYLEARKRTFKTYPRSSLKAVIAGFAVSFLPMMTPVIILAGIVTGITTPTEAAVISVLYAVFLGVVIYKELSPRKILSTLLEIGKMTSRIMLIVSFSFVFGWILTYEGIPTQVARGLLSITENKILILLIINVFILILGCFMESISAMILLIPILVPILNTINVDLMHFGVVFQLNINIGLITPPLGVCSYIAADIAGVPFENVIKAIWPFLVVLIIALMLITYIPQITLLIPKLYGY